MKNLKHLFPALALTLLAIIIVRAEDLSQVTTESLSAAADKKYPTGVISIISPAYCSDITGKTTISLAAPGFSSLTVKCWKQGDGQGSDSTVGTVELDDSGKGTIDFPADDYPHGPITVRFYAKKGSKWDNCYLQLYNKSGVSWNEGIPKTDPPGADGMKLVFSDDFNKMPSISSTDPNATYYDHKPPNGSQDFSSIPFTGFDSPKNPFSQVDSYLRIRADANKNSAGLISSLNNDAKGVKVSAPCYFECRFIAQSAPGTWPAFWLLSDYMTDTKAGKDVSKKGVDELDIIEAVGGDGPGHPNATGEDQYSALYQVTPHAWNQPENKALEDKANQDVGHPVSMRKIGIQGSWFVTPHIYGCKVTDTETIYYLDNVEIARHKTLPVSKKEPLFFLINLATGGGWPVDLSRYGGLADMYVDYVRVYAGDPASSSPNP